MSFLCSKSSQIFRLRIKKTTKIPDLGWHYIIGPFITPLASSIITVPFIHLAPATMTSLLYFQHANKTPTFDLLYLLLSLCLSPDNILGSLIHFIQVYSQCHFIRGLPWLSSTLILPTHSLSSLLVFLCKLSNLTNYIFAYCLPLST